MGCTISKETMVYVCRVDGADEILWFECPLGQVVQRLSKYNAPPAGYVVNIHNPYTRLFIIQGSFVEPGDFYHQVDNMDQLPALLDEENKYGLRFGKQWCVERYRAAIGK